MKLSVAALPFVLLSLAACAPSGSTGDGASSSSAMSEAMMTSSSDAMTDASASSSSAVDAMTVSSASVAASVPASATGVPSVSKLIKISATNFAFTPSTITVKKGQKVTLRVTNAEGVHGFGIPDLGVNVRIEPDQSVDISLDTSKAGTFSFRCTVPCGPGHKEMTGTITIAE